MTATLVKDPTPKAKAKTKKSKAPRIQAVCDRHGKTTFVVYKSPTQKGKRCLKCKHESAAAWRKRASLARLHPKKAKKGKTKK